jgi:hypothetical protein
MTVLLCESLLRHFRARAGLSTIGQECDVTVTLVCDSGVRLVDDADLVLLDDARIGHAALLEKRAIPA